MEDNISNLMKTNLKTDKFTLNNNIYIAKCVKCYDADTIHVVFYLNTKPQRFVCRLLNIDTAEIRSKNIEEKTFAKKARDYLKNIILNKIITIKCGEFDKYGRLLIYIYSYDSKPSSDPNDLTFENSINNTLLHEKFAYQYDGGTKLPFDEWKLL